MDDYVLVCTIVDEDLGSEVLHIAHDIGIGGGTVIKARGSVQSMILNLLGFDDDRKELCLNLISDVKEQRFLEAIEKRFELKKAHHGLAFSLPVYAAIGLRKHKAFVNKREGDGKMDAIFIIVDRGIGEDVIHEAKEAGASGATIMHARGSGIHLKEKIFNFEIEPEKDVVLILSPSIESPKIIKHLNTTFSFDQPGQGILFVLDAKTVVGYNSNS